MKPDWDKLMKNVDKPNILVADVDCTWEGKPICDSNGIRGFPTIKHGDPSNLEDYEGGRDYAALKSFADELKPVCSPSNIDLCEDEDRAKIEEFMALSEDELDEKITDGEQKMEDAEATFKSEVEKLQEKYQQLMQDKDDAI